MQLRGVYVRKRFRLYKPCIPIVLCFLQALTTTCTAQQNVLSYTPSIAGALVMGQGVDIYNVPAQNGDAFTDVSSPNVLDTSVKIGQAQLYLSAITTEEQLQNSMGMSAS